MRARAIVVAVGLLGALGCKDNNEPQLSEATPLRLGDGGFQRPSFLGDAGAAHVVVDPMDPESLYRGGQEAFLAGEFEKGAELFKKSIRLKPLAKTWHALGDALMAQGRFPEAADAFEEAVTLEPTKRISWQRRGRCLFSAGRSKEAAEAFHKAVELKPDDAEGLRDEADALLDAKKDDAAVACLKKALALDAKGAAKDWKLVGESLVRREQWTEAVAALAESAKLHPDPGIFGELGEAQVRAGDLAAARAAFEEGAKLDPKDPLAPEMVAELKLKEGDVAGARASFEESLKAKVRSYPHLALGRIDWKEGKKDDARARLDKALEAAKGEDAAEVREIAVYATEIGNHAAAEKLLALLAGEEGMKDPQVFLALAKARASLKDAKGVKQACDKAKEYLPKDDKTVCPPK